MKIEGSKSEITFLNIQEVQQFFNIGWGGGVRGGARVVKLVRTTLRYFLIISKTIYEQDITFKCASVVALMQALDFLYQKNKLSNEELRLSYLFFEGMSLLIVLITDAQLIWEQWA